MNANSFCGTSKRLTILGPLPPPVTGMTAINFSVYQALRQRTTIRNFCWSADLAAKGLRWKLIRLAGFAKAAIRLMFGSVDRDEILYFPANSEWGMLYDIVVAAIARLRGYRIAVHHHVYSYIDKYDWRMAVLNNLVGCNGIHIVYCTKMQFDFLAKYESKAIFLCVPPTIVSRLLGEVVNSKPIRPFTIGLMSNLTIAKGLAIAVETLNQLLEMQRDVRLILAGPCMGAEEQKVISNAELKWPEKIEYRGPVYGVEKTRFFEDIDAFIFPTQYVNESWGIVLTEAMSAGRPVIAYDRGCIPWIVQNGSGLVIRRESDFVSDACRQLIQWIAEPAEYRKACENARKQNGKLEEQARVEFDDFVDYMTRSIDDL